MQNEAQIIPNLIPAFEALRLGAMAVVPNPWLGLHFYAPPETGHTPHACGLGAMLYAAGVRESISIQNVGRRAIETWPFLGGEIASPREVTRQCDTAVRGTIAAAIENLALSGMSYTAISEWLEPIEAAALECRIAAASPSEKINLVCEQWLNRRTARTAHGLPASGCVA